MDTFWKLAPWISKLILLPPIAIFIMVGIGISLIRWPWLPHKVSHLRLHLGQRYFGQPLGGFPLGCAAFLIYCAASSLRTPNGLDLLNAARGDHLGNPYLRHGS